LKVVGGATDRIGVSGDDDLPGLTLEDARRMITLLLAERTERVLVEIEERRLERLDLLRRRRCRRRGWRWWRLLLGVADQVPEHRAERAADDSATRGCARDLFARCAIAPSRAPHASAGPAEYGADHAAAGRAAVPFPSFHRGTSAAADCRRQPEGPDALPVNHDS